MDLPEIAGLSTAPRRSLEELVDDIPAMPAVAGKIMREMGNPRTTAAKVADIITMDQAITSRILRIANSPVFGAKQKISTVNHALVVIGFSAMKSLVVTVATRGIYKRAALLEQLLWEHSIGCAVASSIIAKAAKAYSPDEAFVGGLMHDVGRTIYADVYHDDYELMFQHIYNQELPRVTLIDLEIEHFGASHMELGQKVAEKWNLSATHQELIANHHANGEKLDTLETPSATAIVGLADTICLHLGIGIRQSDTHTPLYGSPFAKRLGLDDVKLADILDKTLEMFESEKSTFDI